MNVGITADVRTTLGTPRTPDRSHPGEHSVWATVVRNHARSRHPMVRDHSACHSRDRGFDPGNRRQHLDHIWDRADRHRADRVDVELARADVVRRHSTARQRTGLARGRTAFAPGRTVISRGRTAWPQRPTARARAAVPGAGVSAAAIRAASSPCPSSTWEVGAGPPATTLSASSPAARGAPTLSAGRCRHEREDVVPPACEHAVTRLRHLIPRAWSVADRLRHHQPGVIGELLEQHGLGVERA